MLVPIRPILRSWDASFPSLQNHLRVVITFSVPPFCWKSFKGRTQKDAGRMSITHALMTHCRITNVFHFCSQIDFEWTAELSGKGVRGVCDLYEQEVVPVGFGSLNHERCQNYVHFFICTFCWLERFYSFLDFNLKWHSQLYFWHFLVCSWFMALRGHTLVDMVVMGWLTCFQPALCQCVSTVHEFPIPFYANFFALDWLNPHPLVNGLFYLSLFQVTRLYCKQW